MLTIVDLHHEEELSSSAMNKVTGAVGLPTPGPEPDPFPFPFPFPFPYPDPDPHPYPVRFGF